MVTRATDAPPARPRGGPAKKAAPPPPAPELDETEAEDPDEPTGADEEGRAWARFEFKEHRARLYEPTGGQRFVLLQTIGITDESADTQEKLELALGFATMLRSLFVHPEERQFVTGALARGTAEIEDYFGLAKEMAEYWDIESEPPATNRDERRARERRPVAKANVRPRR